MEIKKKNKKQTEWKYTIAEGRFLRAYGNLQIVGGECRGRESRRPSKIKNILHLLFFLCWWKNIFFSLATLWFFSSSADEPSFEQKKN